MTSAATVAQSLSADALIELYELDTSPLTNIYGVAGTGTVYHWTPGTLGNASVYYGGVEYTPLPIAGTGFEWNGQGKLPVPQLQISNLGGFAAALVIEFGDMLGAQVTRTRVFQRFLDGQPGADPSAYFEPDIFVVNRKTGHDKTSITFELRAKMDAQGLQIPRRQVIQNTCTHNYRQWKNGAFIYGSCPYAAQIYYNAANVSQTDPSLDVCGKQFLSCITRFGTAPLPTRAFPGVGITPS